MNYKKSNWLSVYNDAALDLPKQFQCLVEYIFTSIHPVLFCEKGVPKSFAKFGEDLCRNLFINEGAGWNSPTLLKRDPGTGAVL